MTSFLSRRQTKQYVRISVFVSTALFLFFISSRSQEKLIDKHIYLNTTNEIRYKQFCQAVEERIINEKLHNTSIEINPTDNSIPYSYIFWRSSPLLPRLITQCEHAIYMNMLSLLIEHVFKKHNIPYMMMAASLLGSYTHHDMLPWDDDVDILVPLSSRYRLQKIILGELSTEPYSIILMQMHNSRDYDKVFFSWCPHTNRLAWRFPFIDIFYHDENSTHIWLVGKPSNCPVSRRDVYPLVHRPFGPLWLSAPREPMAQFESRKMKNIETKCFQNSYSHRYERKTNDGNLQVDCHTLRQFYPYVERKCTANKCTEILKFGNDSIIHTLTYNYSYRTYLYAERNTSYKAC